MNMLQEKKKFLLKIKECVTLAKITFDLLLKPKINTLNLTKSLFDLFSKNKIYTLKNILVKSDLSQIIKEVPVLQFDQVRKLQQESYKNIFGALTNLNNINVFPQIGNLGVSKIYSEIDRGDGDAR